jgi:hypothetical protein
MSPFFRSEREPPGDDRKRAASMWICRLCLKEVRSLGRPNCVRGHGPMVKKKNLSKHE